MFSLELSPQTVVVAKKNQITPTAQFITFKKKKLRKRADMWSVF